MANSKDDISVEYYLNRMIQIEQDCFAMMGEIMNKRKRAQYIAGRIKEVYKADKVVVCWNVSQARKYNTFKLSSNTVGFAWIKQMPDIDGIAIDDIEIVAPISKQILFDENHDHTASILRVAGHFIANHIDLMAGVSEA